MSDGFVIIDRRKNPKAKSFSNRQRFVNRAKKSIRTAAKKAMGNRSIYDHGDTYVNIPTDGIEEPRFRHHSEIGEYDYVLPGNEEFIVGDKIRKNSQSSSQPQTGSGNGDGDGNEDEFEFAISYDEYLNVIFDDLELPDFSKKTEKNTVTFVNRRAGYTNSGIPTNLNVPKTALAGMARRFALRAPKYKQIHELEEELADLLQLLDVQTFAGEEKAATIERIEEIEDQITSLKAKAMAVSYLDDVDLRYNNFIKQPRPITQAVMFCMMDVSFSMGEHEKVIAKKFFILLHLFLQRRYKNIEVVFVRHHDTAIECNEEDFFTSREAGGTVVSSGYEKIIEIIGQRYPVEDWNIYLAQASDGDNYQNDNDKVISLLSQDLLPILQHFIYLEIEDAERSVFMIDFGTHSSNLWHTLRPLAMKFDNMSCAQIADERQVVNVFRKLFRKEQA